MPRNMEASQGIPLGLGDAIFPGFSIISKLLTETLGLDVAIVIQACGIIVALLGAARYLWRALSSLWSQWFMSYITISSNDRLHEQVMNYMSAKVVQESTRSLNAKASEQGGGTSMDRFSGSENQNDVDAGIPPKYSPAEGKHYFWYQKHLFVLNLHRRNVSGANNRYGNTVDSEELLTLSCHGRSTTPIKKLLLECKRMFAEGKREMTTVRSADPRFQAWRRTSTRLSRPLDSVYLEEGIKQEVIQDIRDFLHPFASRFYARRGIPYRRGYLFYGEPGTGKTSLSLALAGAFGLELFVLSLSDPEMTDQKLGYLFASLPPRGIVLLEDIDAVGLFRPRSADDEVKAEKAKAAEVARDTGDRPTGLRRGGAAPQGITLSGALNAIDGVASQEGRILIMTTNDPESLDKALIRPGRIDLQVHFGHVSRSHAHQMFERMYTPDEDDTTTAFTVKEISDKPEESTAETVKEMAIRFSEEVPEAQLTPAELQGFLLARRNKPAKAFQDLVSWVETVLAAKTDERNILKKKREISTITRDESKD